MVGAEGSQLIVGQRVSDSATNAGQLEPDQQNIPKELRRPTTRWRPAGLCPDGFARNARIAALRW